MAVFSPRADEALHERREWPLATPSGVGDAAETRTRPFNENFHTRPHDVPADHHHVLNHEVEHDFPASGRK